MTPGGLCFKCEQWVGRAGYEPPGVRKVPGEWDKENRRFVCFECEPERRGRRCTNCVVNAGTIVVEGGLECASCYNATTQRFREGGYRDEDGNVVPPRPDVAAMRDAYRDGGDDALRSETARQAIAHLGNRLALAKKMNVTMPDRRSIAINMQSNDERVSFDGEMAKLGLGRLRNKHARKRKIR